MIEENIIAVLFHPNFILANFIFRAIGLPNPKTSALFASAYLVPDTFSIYYPISVIGCVSAFDFVERNTWSFARECFLKAHEAEMKIK